MRLIPTLALCCLATFQCIAQSTTFTIGVLMPDAQSTTNQVDEAQMQKLESKIVEMVNNSNEATFGYSNDFVICPKLSVEETGRVEGGMQNIMVTTVSLTLMVKQISSNTVYNAVSRKIKGSGNTKEQSISSAISTINPSDNFYAQFITLSKEKIIAYYRDNCQRIMQEAKACETRKDYEQAISLLQSIPEQAPCYKEASKKAVDLYIKYKNVLCSQFVTLAKSEMALKNYEMALVALNLSDPTSNCSGEVKKLISEISARTDKQEQREYNLEVMRINAVKEIGKAYFAHEASSRSRRRR